MMNRLDYGKTFTLWRDAAGQSWTDYTEHRFVQQLQDGSLAEAAFLHYLKQDYVFLIHFSRAWALAVTKADTVEEMRLCAATVNALIGDEIQLHIKSCGEHGIPEQELFSTAEHPANIAYTRYVLDAGHSGDFLDLLAALAPCVLGYGAIGSRLFATDYHARYAPWINVYGGADYQESCRRVGTLIDHAVTRRLGDTATASPRWPTLCQRFTTATRLEVGFWDMGLAPQPPA